ncbi:MULTISPECIES: ABC transporter transmembrane domain-containing protein [unclassified Caballeronia]|uniref:ABC transporter transmembrane domain-containing protein n=1 Tax=unclassified Caballeronia TaxID=2646786 RepID=UPI0032EDE673
MDKNTSAQQGGAAHKKSDSGFLCLKLLARMHGVAVDESRLRHEFGVAPFDTLRILVVARTLGLAGKAVKQDPERLDRAPLPAIALDRHSGEYLIVTRVKTDAPDGATQVLIQRCGESPEVIALSTLLESWSGELIFLSIKGDFAGQRARFDFSWFIPAIVKYRRLLGEVLLISLFLQLIGLATPLFFQVVMDKVLVNHAMTTLNVIALGLECATLFYGILTGLRTWMFAHTSRKIDVELGARLFRHLFQLPIAYFHARRVGDSVARIRELENIRSFLTGNAMTLVMDVLFSIIFLAVMLCYSAQLTLIVALSIPLTIPIFDGFSRTYKIRGAQAWSDQAEAQLQDVQLPILTDFVKAYTDAKAALKNLLASQTLLAAAQDARSIVHVGAMTAVRRTSLNWSTRRMV